MKSWSFYAVPVTSVWSGLISVGWPGSCGGFCVLLLYVANIFGYWPANSEAKGEDCMVVTGWWNNPHGKAKHGRLTSTIWRHSSASMFTGLDSLRTFPVGLSEVWRVCCWPLLYPGTVLPHSEGNWNKYRYLIVPNCAELRTDTGLYRMSRS
jgi:hypothetical protein